MKRSGDKGVIPDGWQVVHLGDVAGTRKEQVKPETGDPRPYIALEHIVSEGGLNGYGRAGESISNKTLFETGDTLYGKLRPNLKKVIRAEFDGVCSTDILAVFAHERTDRSFLGHLLRSNPLHLHAMQGVAGTKMPRTSWNHLRRFRFPIPPLSEQRAIAEVLDSIDDAIERTDAVIAATEQLRDSLLHELLTRGVPGWHSEWKEVPGLGTTPADWEVVRLGEVCAPPEYGASAAAHPYDPESPRYVRITDLTDDGHLNPHDARSAYPDQVIGYELEHGDLLFARSGATVGKTYMYRAEDGLCVFAGYLIRFQAHRNRVDPRFLSIWTHSLAYKKWVASMFRAGAQPNINAAEYASMPLPCPPLHEQCAIADTLSALDESIKAEKRQCELLAASKTSVSDVLLEGQVRLNVSEVAQ